MQKELFKTFKRAVKKLDESELVITRPDGVIVENPYLTIMHDMAVLIIEIERDKLDL